MKHMLAGLRAGPSKIAGTGCFAARDFKVGEIVGEYTGERITEEEADSRYEELEGLTYLFEVDDDEYIDAMYEDNPVKFINHACNPNCESDQRGSRIFILAIRDIKEGEELTYDYNLQIEDEDEKDEHPCNCGAPNCRGTQAAPPEDED